MLIDKINRILIIQLRQIGDVLLTTPFVKILKESKEGSFVAFMTEEAPAQVLYNNPYIDEVILYKKTNNPLHDPLFFISMRKYNFDTVIDLLGTPGTALASLLSGARYRAGYGLRGRKYAYNMKVGFNSALKYNALRKLEILELFGITHKEHSLILHLNKNDRKAADDFFKTENIGTDTFIVSFSPTSRRQARRWTQKGYAELAKLLVSKYNAVVLMLWGPGEYDYVSEIARFAGEGAFIIPETDVREMAAFIEKSHLLVCNDNGQKHIATALGVPTVTIFGPTSEVVWNPPERDKFRIVAGNVDCIKCGRQTCENHICMDAVTPTDVENEIVQIKELQRFIRK